MNPIEGHVSEGGWKIKEKIRMAAGVVLILSGCVNYFGGYGRRFFEHILGPDWESYGDFAFNLELPRSCLVDRPAVRYTPGETFKIFIRTFSDSFKHCVASQDSELCIESALKTLCFDPTYNAADPHVLGFKMGGELTGEVNGVTFCDTLVDPLGKGPVITKYLAEYTAKHLNELKTYIQGEVCAHASIYSDIVTICLISLGICIIAAPFVYRKLKNSWK